MTKYTWMARNQDIVYKWSDMSNHIISLKCNLLRPWYSFKKVSKGQYVYCRPRERHERTTHRYYNARIFRGIYYLHVRYVYDHL